MPHRAHAPLGQRLPVSDGARLAVVEDLGIAGHARIGGLDAAIRLLAASCDVPVAVVNVVRPGRQTYPAEVGVGAPCTEVPDELSFCAQVVETAGLVRVADARLHPVYGANPLVQAGQIRAYAGVPLRHAGVVVGAVSIFDRRPRRFGPKVVDALEATARVVEEVLDLRQTTRRDPLTGLASRAEATAQGEQLLRRGAAAALLVDIDHFRLHNSLYGGPAADAMLVALADRLGGVAADLGGVVARWGADEFLLAVPGADVAAAEAAAHRAAHSVLGAEWAAAPASVTIGASAVGRGTPWSELVRRAAGACSAGKHDRRGQVTVWSDGIAASIEQRADLQVRLAAAVRDGALRVAFQPIVDASDGAVTSLEALVRWPGAPRGVTPLMFIEVAEASDLIITLGAAVLDMTCAHLAAWCRRFPTARTVTVWVNASPIELEHPGYVERVGAALTRHGLPPEALGVEVTETAASLERWQTVDTLAALRAAGVKVALDDFGTGYSSLGRLQRLPVDRLKLDRSFVAALDPSDERSVAYVKAVVDLGRALGLVVVAEGVETRAEQLIVEALGCDAMQGFLFHRPAPPDELPAALAWQPDDERPARRRRVLATADGR
ncbi:MAG TPA: EAL domain-containing protein [Acidimicrobiales bacterium]|nr:EAL domain-containing protein [Acidimicrobiales bacterium]